MAGSKTLEIIVTATDKGATKAFKDIDSAAGTTQGKLSKLGSEIGPGLTVAAAAVVGGVGLALKSAFSAAEESAKISRETERVLKTTGASAWTTADQIGELANKTSKLTGVDDELIQSASNLLLTFTNVQNQTGKNNDVFDQATLLALDMSTALGTDASGAAIQLGKALNDPEKGITALSRAGVSFTEQQKDQIRTLQESGDMLGAQKIILAELSKEFGGAAEAAKTPLDDLKVKLGNFQESLGATLIPIVSGAADKLRFMIEMFEALPGGAQIAIVAIGGIATAIGTGVVLYDKLADTFGPVMQKIMPAVGGLIDNVGLKIGTLAEKAGMGADAATNLASSFGTVLVGALAVAAVAMIAYTFYAKAQADDAKEAEAGIKTYTEALDAQTGSLEDNVNLATAKLLADKDIADNLVGTSTDLKMLGDQLVNNQQGFEEFRDAWDEATGSLDIPEQTSDALGLTTIAADRFMEKLKELAAQGDPVATEMLRLKNAGELNNVEIKDLVLTFDDLQDQYENSQKGSEATRQVMDGMAGASNNAVTSIDKQVASLDALINKNLELTNPYFAHLKAQEALTKAQNDYNEAVRTYGTNSPQAVDAAGAQLQAGLKLEEAILKLNKAQTDGSTSQEAMAVKVAELSRLFGIGSVDLDTYKTRLLDMGYTVDVINGKPVVIKVDYEKIKEAIDAVAELDRKFLQVNGLHRGFDGEVYDQYGNMVNLTGQYAQGGMVGDGLFTVGEQGPELGYKSGNSVRIFSNPDSVRMIGSTGNKSTNIYNTINMPAGANGDDVVRALKQYERANGALYASA
jgi:hypothetical protein